MATATTTTTPAPSIQRELAIRSESIQRVYNFYRNNLFFVNRRYQRKLIWTIEEKRAFIDSILKGYPVPIVLLAEAQYESGQILEIIDGMQRLNAIVSFIENEFDVDGKYFDLNTMVESKSAVDKGDLTQVEPVMPRRNCEIIASYVLPLSVYAFDDKAKVDEIFRRINANGKHLSRQEIRSAGTLGLFSELVRKISSEIRTDVTRTDVLNLSKMKEISITNQNLNYGISVEDIFYVKNSIITKDMVRDSRDEEIVADLVASMILPEMPASNSELLDQYFGLVNTDKTSELEDAIRRIGQEAIQRQYIGVYNELRKVLDHAKKTFQELVFGQPSQRVPRYFIVVFLAFYRLLYKENKEVADYDELVRNLTGIAVNINITTGGNWSSINKNDNISAAWGRIAGSFKDSTTQDPANQKWFTEFEALLMQSKTEQTLYDFKQGFTTLDGSNTFDPDSFSKIIKTLTAMTNNSRKAIGYICVGVADNHATAERIKALYKVEAVVYRGFEITGVGHEATLLQGNIDNFFRWLISEIKKQPLPDEAKDGICRGIRVINYFGKDVVIFRLEAGSKPFFYDSKFYRRHGSSVDEVPPEQYPDFFTNY